MTPPMDSPKVNLTASIPCLIHCLYTTPIAEPIQSQAQAWLVAAAGMGEVGRIASSQWPNAFLPQQSRSDQLPQGDPGCPDAAGRSHPGLVPAAGRRTRNPEQMREPAGSGALCPASPQRPHRGVGPGAQASTLGYRLSQILFCRSMSHPSALPSGTGRSLRSQVVQRISISWCV